MVSNRTSHICEGQPGAGEAFNSHSTNSAAEVTRRTPNCSSGTICIWLSIQAIRMSPGNTCYAYALSSWHGLHLVYTSHCRPPEMPGPWVALVLLGDGSVGHHHLLTSPAASEFTKQTRGLGSQSVTATQTCPLKSVSHLHLGPRNPQMFQGVAQLSLDLKVIPKGFDSKL